MLGAWGFLEYDAAMETNALPDWCKVYDGLSDEQLAEIEAIVLTRSDFTRTGISELPSGSDASIWDPQAP